MDILEQAHGSDLASELREVKISIDAETHLVLPLDLNLIGALYMKFKTSLLSK